VKKGSTSALSTVRGFRQVVRWQAMAYGLWLRSFSCSLHGQRMGCPTGTETDQEWDGKVTTEIQQHPDLVSVTYHVVMYNEK
jgi:hypothetical protein